MKIKLYVSGPMTGLPNNNVLAFNKATKKLRKKGFKVVNPAELDSGEPCRTWVACLRRDLKWLVTCDMIATLPGWKKSKGATLEVHVGKQLSFPIHSVGYYLKRRNK